MKEHKTFGPNVMCVECCSWTYLSDDLNMADLVKIVLSLRVQLLILKLKTQSSALNGAK